GERVTDDMIEALPAEPVAEAEAFEEEPAKGRRPRARKKISDEGEKAKPRGRPAKGEPARAASRRGAPRAGGRRAAPEIAAADETGESEAESFQRVTDEDLDQDAGELLKDAMLQERIIEQVHNAEYRTTPTASEPEPEWRVGSLRSQVSGGSDFHRVVDESGEA